MTGDQPPEPLRIGVLGAARIAALAIVDPARTTGDRLVAVAARDRRRAEAFAATHGVERVLDSYAEVVADPEVEVVYNPLANGLHGHWNLRAVEAGKHVLAEKPFASNAAEARAVAGAAATAGVVVLEAFHYPFHPLFQRACELVTDGAVGRVRHVETVLGMPSPHDTDPRWSLALAGGATMDLGCYALHAQRQLGLRALGGEPRASVATARERDGRPGVDAAMHVELAFPDGSTGTAACDMESPKVDFHLTVTGSEGVLHVPSYPIPHEDDRLELRRSGEPVVVEHLGTRSSYTYQLEAFAAAVRGTGGLPYDVRDAVAQAELIDTAYVMAGLAPRQPTVG